jgi:uncharacterized membrane protein YfcA
MSARERALATLGGGLAGLAGGLFGVGGGVMLVPILTGPFRLTQHQAHGTSLAAIGATAIAALLVYGASANVAWGVALRVALASVLTAPLGARWASRISARGLRRAFAVFLVVVAARLLWEVPVAGARVVPEGLAGWGFELALGAAVGLFAGFMGVGGGILAVPAFTLLLGMTQQTSQGTSLAVILATAPAGAIAHARHGNVAGRFVPWLALGSALGAPLAAWLATRLDHTLLVRAFAVFLLVTAVQTWWRAGAARPPEAAAPESAPRAGGEER